VTAPGSASDDCYARGLAPAVGLALAKQEPIERHALLDGERDEKVGVRCSAALITIDVLLEHTEVSRELALGAIPAYLGESLRELLLETFD
jgi:hypothetical protein